MLKYSVELYKYALQILSSKDIEVTLTEDGQHILKQIVVLLNGELKLFEFTELITDLETDISFLKLTEEEKDIQSWSETFKKIRKQLVTIYSAVFEDLSVAKSLINKISIDYNHYLNIDGLQFTLENFGKDIKSFQLLHELPAVTKFAEFTYNLRSWIISRFSDLSQLSQLLNAFGYNTHQFGGDYILPRAYLDLSHYYPVTDHPGSVHLDYQKIEKRIQFAKEQSKVSLRKEEIWLKLVVQAQQKQII